MQKSINEKSYFFHLGRSIKIVFSADRSHKCDHRQISQASVAFPEKHQPSRRCGGWGGGGGEISILQPWSISKLPLFCFPSLTLDPSKSFFSPRRNAEVPCSWCLPPLHRGGTKVGSFLAQVCDLCLLVWSRSQLGEAGTCYLKWSPEWKLKDLGTNTVPFWQWRLFRGN